MSRNIHFPPRRVRVFVQEIIRPTLFNLDIQDSEWIRNRYQGLASTNTYERTPVAGGDPEQRISYWARVHSITVETGLRRAKDAAMTRLAELFEEYNYEVDVIVSDVDRYQRILFEFCDPRFNQVYEDSVAFGRFVDRRKPKRTSSEYSSSVETRIE